MVRARADLRRLGAWLPLAILTGVVGGILVGAAAGARRTASVHDRFLAATDAADAFYYVGCGVDPFTVPNSAGAEACGQVSPVDRMARLPSVAAAQGWEQSVVPVTSFDGRVLNPTGDPCETGTGELTLVSTTKSTSGSGFNVVQITAGRQVDETDPTSIVVSLPFAERASLKVGDRILVFGEFEDCEAAETWGPPTELRIDGIGLMQMEVVPDQGYYFEGIHVSAAADLVPAETSDRGIIGIRAVRGQTLAEIEVEAEAAGLVVRPTIDVVDTSANVDARLRVDVTAMWLVAGVGFLALAFVLGTVLARLAASITGDAPILGVIGWVKRDIIALGAIEGAVVGAVAASITIVVATVSSLFTPLGDARFVEPDRGLRFDVVSLWVGAALIVAVIIAAFTAGAWRSTRHGFAAGEEGPSRPALLVRLTYALPRLPVQAFAGLRLASTGRRGPTVRSLWSGVGGVIVGVGVIVGSLTFIRSTDHLVATPRLTGWNWDAYMFVGESQGDQVAHDVEALSADPSVVAAGSGVIFWYGVVETSDGTTLFPVGFDARLGAVTPTMIDGRSPATPHEAVVGPRAVAVHGYEIGQRIEILSDDFSDAAAPITAAYDIVGVAALPFDDGNRDSGVALTLEGLARLAPRGFEVTPQIIMVDLVQPDQWPAVAGRAGIPRARVDESSIWGKALVDEVADNSLVGRNVTRARRAPMALIGVLGLMVAGVLAHLVATTVHERRRDFAVLRALGFTTRQLRSTIAFLVTVLAATTAVIAVPPGYLAGRAFWLDHARSLFVLPESRFPWTSAGIAIALLLTLVNLVAVIPARRATRSATADLLRAE